MSSSFFFVSFVFRIVQSFETIVDTLISQENFTEVLVIEEDVALIAEQVSDAYDEGLRYRYLITHFVYSTPHDLSDTKK